MAKRAHLYTEVENPSCVDNSYRNSSGELRQGREKVSTYLALNLSVQLKEGKHTDQRQHALQHGDTRTKNQSAVRHLDHTTMASRIEGQVVLRILTDLIRAGEPLPASE